MIRRNSLLRALILFLPLVTVAAHAEEQIQAPVFKEGDLWQYRLSIKPSDGGSPTNNSFILRYADGATQVVRIVDGKEVPLKQSQRIPRLLQLFGFQQSERTQLLQFPLYIGKQWRDSYKPPRPRAATQVFNMEVVAVERVATQAGTFQTFKIERSQHYSIAHPEWGGGIVRVDSSYFYSSETKSIVKYDGDFLNGDSEHFELVKFEPGR